ncbi:MAG TPA: YciI family protein [Myxococcota bacterium]|nr:YciI family protein [Myxococcota bacterium]
MEVMLVFLDRRSESPREVIFPEMRQYAAELSQRGTMRSGAPLRPESEGVRVRLQRGAAQVLDGPFAESKEVVSGFILLDVPSFADALELAKRCPAARVGPVDVRKAMADREADPPAGSRRWLLLFLESPAAEGDPDGSKYEAMTRWTDELRRDRKYVECAGLPKSHPGARVEQRGGKTAVSDGPFAESKEIVGGYALVEAKSRDEALAIAKRCPHAAWGDVEVREVLQVPAA